jgi:pyrroline-5-carboxylate reductase
MFSNELKTKTTTENQNVLNAADLIILCIKPQMTLPVLSPLKFERKHVVVSILAGVPVEVLKHATGPNPKFVRVMPNTPMLCNEVRVSKYSK